MNEDSLDAGEREAKAREELLSFVKYLNNKYAVRLDIGVKLGFTALKQHDTASEVSPESLRAKQDERDVL